MSNPEMNLNDFFKPGKPLPPDALMIAKSLEILELSPHGQQLVNFASKKEITIKIATTPQATTYIPEKKLIYIGINRNSPGSPSRFILMLVGALREAQQEAAGVKHPPLQAPVDEHKKVSLSKEEDKLWYMCTVGFELDGQPMFTEYKFIDELRKMGHTETIELYIRQERKK